MAVAGTLATSRPAHKSFEVLLEAPDTVVYPMDAYKLNRKGAMEEVALSDSLLASMQGFFGSSEEEDEGEQLTARDTIHAPDSLRETDPFRYKYYVALLDSLTHIQVADSLGESMQIHLDSLDTLGFLRDSIDLHLLDSIYNADLAVRRREAFEKWYNSLSPEERKKYDKQQEINRKAAIKDSLDAIKEEKKAIHDSIVENTPRVLETFALPDSLMYKRLVAWTVDPAFQNIKPYVPDTSYNYYFNDYDFRRKDVNATWLGVAGSPVQSYDFFQRTNHSETDFYAPNEAWTFSHETLPHYNTKTPYTEMAYWGSILATSSKESDNIHFLTTQNITPALNMRIMFDRWGGGGILQNETTANKTFVLSGNYVGRKYMAHAGFISNNVSRGENGGITEQTWIRDTTIDSREIAVNMSDAVSTVKRRTFFLDQEYRIPLSFIKDLLSAREKADSASIQASSAGQEDLPPAEDGPQVDTIDRNVTTAFIGHSSEWSSYYRDYSDAVYSGSAAAGNLFNNIFNYSPYSTADTMRTSTLDNKVFVRLQPWSSDAMVNRLNIGLGDKFRTYRDQYADTLGVHKENSLYAYAGVEGNIRDNFSWDARGVLNFAGYEAGDFELSANARFNLYPFRRARRSPLSFGAHFETTLDEPQWYQQRLFLNHYSWDNDFGKISRTKIQGYLDIPHWKLSAKAGYALLANHIYYDTLGVVQQHSAPISVLSASLRKEFTVAGFLHLDNRLLFQTSSNPDVLPLPAVSANLRWYVQFVAQKSEDRLFDILTMQAGLNAWYNTAWYAPAWNPNLGVFHNQNEALYNNGLVVDAFVNMQWKRACIFLKVENLNMGWPFESADYFSAHNFISTQRVFKVGIFWPFYMTPGKDAPNAKQRQGGTGDNAQRR